MKSAGKSARPRSKSEVYKDLAEANGLTRKQVSGVFDSLAGMIKKDLNKGAGVFAVPGLMKIVVVRKPATKSKTVPNPFKPGEMMTVKAKPARKLVKVRALKSLKEMV